MLPKGKAKARISSTSTTRPQQPVETGVSSSGAATATQPAAAGSVLRRVSPAYERTAGAAGAAAGWNSRW